MDGKEIDPIYTGKQIMMPKLWHLMQKNGLNQLRLSVKLRELGYTTSNVTIGRWLSGEQNCNEKNRQILADYFKVSIEEIG